MEDEVDQHTKGPDVGDFGLVLTDEDFGGLVEFDFLFAFGGGGFGDFHVLWGFDVEVEDKDLFRTYSLKGVLLDELKAKL